MGAPPLTVPEENECGCAERAGGGGPGCLCCTTALMQIIGRKYALRLFFLIGERRAVRFNELRGEMDDMSTSTLSIRLAELENAGLIRRQTFPENPPRVEYSLTDEGRELRKSLFGLSRFARRKA